MQVKQFSVHGGVAVGNPNLAIQSSKDVSVQIKVLESAWYTFIYENREPDRLRRDVFQSWKRCQTFGVNPRQKQTAIVLSDEQLHEWRLQSKLYRTALPVIVGASSQIEGTRHLMTLADHHGRIVYLAGEAPIRRRAEQMNFVIGADWSEASAGTNAIGTCIAANQPIQIFSFEHFCEGCHGWVCSAAPIRDPLTGQLLGVIDLTGPAEDAQPHTLGFAAMTARMIEQQLQRTAQQMHQYLQQWFLPYMEKWPHDPIVILDETLHIVTATAPALTLFRGPEADAGLPKTDVDYLKFRLLTMKERQAEWVLPESRWLVHVQVAQREQENVGFLVHFRKIVRQVAKMLDVMQDWEGIVGASLPMIRVLEKSRIVAPKNIPVLITGESGTGKELLARAIHRASLRHQKPFIAINCGAIPKDLIASELFGYEAGAFTGGNPKGKMGKIEAAQGGTLFLDEIGEMPLDLQVFLLRVLQEKEIVRLGSTKPISVDVRIIAATNQDLEALIRQGKFRSDLYYRLNVVQLTLPPLRERGDDLVRLCDHFLAQLSRQHGKPIRGLTADALALLKQYAWPGNVRELKNVLEHAVLFGEGETITIADLPTYLLAKTQQEAADEEPWSPLEMEEKKRLIQLYHETGGNWSEVARRLRMARSTLYRKLKKYGIQ